MTDAILATVGLLFVLIGAHALYHNSKKERMRFQHELEKDRMQYQHELDKDRIEFSQYK